MLNRKQLDYGSRRQRQHGHSGETDSYGQNESRYGDEVPYSRRDEGRNEYGYERRPEASLFGPQVGDEEGRGHQGRHRQEERSSEDTYETSGRPGYQPSYQPPLPPFGGMGYENNRMKFQSGGDEYQGRDEYGGGNDYYGDRESHHRARQSGFERQEAHGEEGPVGVGRHGGGIRYGEEDSFGVERLNLGEPEESHGRRHHHHHRRDE